MQIHSERLLIRSYRREDARALHHAVQASLSCVGRWLPWCNADYSLAVAQTWITACERAQADGNAFDLGMFLRDSGHFCGSVGITQIDRDNACGNIGYWLAPDQRGHGLASEAVRAIIPFGFDQLHLKRLEIVVAVGNHASRKVTERLGARFEGIVRNRVQLADCVCDAWLYSVRA